MSATDYINTYKDDAINEMKRSGIPASITLAQGILESDAGNSDLALQAKNHFGIKCHNEWTGETFIMDDDEKNECFRKYISVMDSYDDHGKFLRERPRYAFLFEYEPTDYKSWAYGLKKAGYATNPQYAELLIKIIEENGLGTFDTGGSKIPVSQTQAQQGNGKEEHSGGAIAQHPKTKQSNLKSGDMHGTPFITAVKGDSWYSIAIANEMRLWQILKYNDAEKNDVLEEGDIVYLKPKRGDPDEEFHTVSTGETIRDVAQKYGIKINRLIRINHLQEDITLKPGSKLRLK
jgi:LysM repeat protein